MSENIKTLPNILEKKVFIYIKIKNEIEFTCLLHKLLICSSIIANI